MSATEYIIKTSIPQPEPNVQVRIDNTLQIFLSYECEDLLWFTYMGLRFIIGILNWVKITFSLRLSMWLIQ